MRNVCYMHSYLPIPVIELSQGKGIVKVLGIGRVDGECGNSPEIATLLIFFFRNSIRQRVCNTFNLSRKFIRYFKFGENGMHFSIVFSRKTKNIDNFADGIFIAAGPLDDAHNCFLTILRLVQAFHGNKNVGRNLFPIRNQEGKILRHLDHSNNGVPCTFYNFNYFAFRARFFALCKKVHLHRITMQSMVQVSHGYKNIFGIFVGYNKSVTVPCKVYLTGYVSLAFR